MKKAVKLILGLMTAFVTALPAYAVTDGYYDLSDTTYTWDGIDTDRFKTPTADYNYSYGDEDILTYSLPWSFNYYGQSYSSINIDTNGNIWFSYNGTASSFNLANTGVGPVITAWNNDLSSHYYGGSFVQHKTNPERVVIEWQTETYTEEGSYLANNFEVVLFQSGIIRFDYKTFNSAAPDDFGSGISKGDSSGYISIDSVYNRANMSFTALPFYSITTAGTGGTITPSTARVIYGGSQAFGIATNTGYVLSSVTGCGGTLSGNTYTTGPVTADCTVTANFTCLNSPVRIPGKADYSTLQAAYNAAVSGDTIQSQAVTFTENLTANRDISVTLDGGYSCDYSTNPGSTALSGSMTTNSGTLNIKNFNLQY